MHDFTTDRLSLPEIVYLTGGSHEKEIDTDISSCGIVWRFALRQIVTQFQTCPHSYRRGGWLTPFAFNSLRSSMNKAENPKTETAHFRLTAEEKQFLQRQADSCGLSLSNYFRSVCLGFQPRQRLTAEQIELLREVRKLRSDLVHINNYTKHNPNWSGIRSELEGIIPKLTDLLDY